MRGLRKYFVISDSLELPECSPATLNCILDAVERAISGYEPRKIVRNSSEIRFQAGFLSFPNWNLLLSIDQGRIWVVVSKNTARLHYQISFFHLFIVSVSLPLAVAVGSPDGFPIWTAVIVALLIFVSNFVLTLFRFSRLLRRIAANFLQGVAKKELACSEIWPNY
jgi:hypothetical protein